MVSSTRVTVIPSFYHNLQWQLSRHSIRNWSCFRLDLLNCNLDLGHFFNYFDIVSLYNLVSVDVDFLDSGRSDNLNNFFLNVFSWSNGNNFLGELVVNNCNLEGFSITNNLHVVNNMVRGGFSYNLFNLINLYLSFADQVNNFLNFSAFKFFLS